MKYNDLRKRLKTPFFTRQDLRILGARVFDYQLSRWQKQGYIVKLKNGLYILADQFEQILPEEAAGQLYAPSYISIEWILSNLGIIPEMVYAVTSVTPKTTRRFKNELGNFIYRHIKPSLFWGYKQIKSKNASYLMAEPEKAWLDFIYFNLNKMKTTAALAEMRFNRQALKKVISKNKLRQYLALYKNKRMATVCRQVVGGF